MPNQTEKWIFVCKENFEEILKYHEGPPCSICSDKEMCFNAAIDDDGTYVIDTNKTCDEANIWFMTAEYFDDFIDDFKMLPEGLLKTEDIEKLSQPEDSVDLENKMEFSELDEPELGYLEIFVSTLRVLLSGFDKDEIMREFINPFISDQTILLEERKNQPTVCNCNTLSSFDVRMNSS